MVYKTGTCDCCEQERMIVNKTHRLCDPCNKVRLNGQRTTEPKVKKKIPYFSEKGRVAKAEVTKMKKGKIEEARENGRLFCEGCLKSKGLDNSHILSEKNYPQFRAEKENISLLCRDCHNKWENGTIQQKAQLSCFQKDMAYIFRVEPKRFWVLFYDLVDAPDFMSKAWHLQKLKNLKSIESE